MHQGREPSMRELDLCEAVVLAVVTIGIGLEVLDDGVKSIGFVLLVSP